MGGGRLREVVAMRELTVHRLRKIVVSKIQLPPGALRVEPKRRLLTPSTI